MFCFFLFSSLCFSQIQLTNYTYNTHGEDWNISVCLKGFKQSPINISDHNITAYSNIHYFFAKYSSAASTANYLNVSLEISANDQNLGYGTLLTVVPDSRGSKKAFLAQSILFRSPAEHIVNNYRYPLEVQIYHKVMIDFGKYKNFKLCSLRKPPLLNMQLFLYSLIIQIMGMISSTTSSSTINPIKTHIMST